MAGTPIRGKDLVLKIGSTVVGLAAECSLSISNDVIETTTKDNADFKTYIYGDSEGELSHSGLYAENDTNGITALLNEAFEKDADVTFAFEQNTLAEGSIKFTGTCLVTNIEIGASNGETVSFSASLKPAGAIVKTVHTV